MAEKNFEGNEDRNNKDKSACEVSTDKYAFIGNTRDPKTRQQEHLFVWNAYKSTGGFKSGEYLYEFAREVNYKLRKTLAVYKNYVASILDPIVNPVFSKPALRVFVNDIITAFVDDCNRKGANLHKFIKSATISTRLLGVSFVIVDNVADLEGVTTQDAVINSRSFPYVYQRQSFLVSSHKEDEVTGDITEVCFHEGVHKVGDVIYRKQRCWTKNESYFFYEDKGNCTNGNPARVTIGEPSVHGLGIIPIVMTYMDAGEEFLPSSPYFDFARQCLGIYNKDSEGRNVERLSGFPVLGLPGTKPDDDIDLGTDSVLFFDEDSRNIPVYISPPSDIMEVMGKSSDKSADSLLSMAAVLGAKAVNSGASAKSGDALAFEFMGQSGELDMSATVGEEIEKGIMRIIGKYLSNDIDYDVTYDSNFTPTNKQVDDKIATSERLSDRGMSTASSFAYDSEIIKQSAILYDWDDKYVEDLIASIKNDASLI